VDRIAFLLAWLKTHAGDHCGNQPIRSGPES
jgi:hypothetical protein